MSIRRQAYQWEIKDLGQLPAKRLEELTKPQSIFTSGFGNATLKARLRTKPTEYVVIKYFGSTPGIFGTGNDWVPGYVNFQIGVTSYFLNPDGRPVPRFVGKCRPLPNFHKICAPLLLPIGILRYPPTQIGTSNTSFQTV